MPTPVLAYTSNGQSSVTEGGSPVFASTTAKKGDLIIQGTVDVPGAGSRPFACPITDVRTVYEFFMKNDGPDPVTVFPNGVQPPTIPNIVLAAGDFIHLVGQAAVSSFFYRWTGAAYYTFDRFTFNSIAGTPGNPDPWGRIRLYFMLAI